MKGNFKQECNRTVCNNNPAMWYNYSTKKFYCSHCASLINKANKADAFRLYGHDLCVPYGYMSYDLTPTKSITFDKAAQDALPQEIKDKMKADREKARGISITKPNTGKIDNNIYTENSIRTFTGKVFDLKILDPESICIEDIAHALSNVSRFGGHLEKHYSVAQHSVLITLNCRDDKNRLAALLHDASEAYIGDMPSPFKKMLPDYKRVEEQLMGVIAAKFGFQFPFPKEVKELDRIFLNMEWDSLVMKTNNHIEYWTPEEAKEEFLNLYNHITLKK